MPSTWNSRGGSIAHFPRCAYTGKCSTAAINLELSLEAPENLDQAQALATSAVRERQSLEDSLDRVRAEFDVLRVALTEHRATMTGDELAAAEEQLDDSRFELECAQHALDYFAPEFEIWASGYQFDDRGEEFWVWVQYSPLAFLYEVLRGSEHGEQFKGSYQARAEALARARDEVYGYSEPDVAARPEPTITRADSDAAGDVIIQFNGQATAVKTVVDQALDQAGSGCGQHYEIFARRAQDALGQLPHCVTNLVEREALQSYLAYERF